MSAGPRVRLPVAVIMGRRTVSGRGWTVPSWRVVGVVSGADLPGREAQGVPVRSGEEEEQLLWGGLQLELYRDAADSYWVNLTGAQPSLFILCNETDSGLAPKLVTVDQNEACSGVEGDDRVFSVAIPPEVYRYIEAFVIEHHAPKEKRKRKRVDWSPSEKS